MAYVSREIKDRIAVGDDIFRIVELADGRVQLVPSPDSVTENGTPINKELLQVIEDRVVWLMNRLYDDITSNPFRISFSDLDGLKVQGVWNESQSRIEC